MRPPAWWWRPARAVKGFRVGDRVTFDSTIWCGECFYCRRGEVNLCDNRQVLGVSPGEYRRHGAFAEYVAVPQRILYRLPDELSFEHAAMIEAVSVAVHAVSITPVKLDDTAVVVGSGMIGLLAVQALKLAGCGRVIAVDVDDARLRMAAELGADAQVNSKSADAVDFIRGMTAGRGADIALEVVGATEPFQTALASVRKGGALTLVGNLSPKDRAAAAIGGDAADPRAGLLRLFGRIPRLHRPAGARGHPRCAPDQRQSAARRRPAWFQRLYSREPNLMKVILQP